MKNNWQTEKLGEICTVDWGNTSISKKFYLSSGYRAYSATGQDGFVEKFEHEGNGIVLSAIGARCGKCFWAKDRWTAIKNTIVIKAKDEKILDLRYLYFLTNDEKFWSKSGAAQPFITLTSARVQIIPLPPLSTQQQIVEKLDAIRKLQELNNKEIDKAGELFETLLVNNLLPQKGWTENILRDLLSLSSGKFMPSKNHDNDGKIPVYGGNGINGYVNKPLVENPTVVIGRVGAYCGNVYFVSEPCWITDNAIYIKSYNSNLINLKYLYFFLRRKDLHQYSSISGQPKITQDPILKMKIKLPPLKEQEAIVFRLESINHNLNTLMKIKLSLKELFESVLHKAMKGELVN